MVPVYFLAPLGRLEKKNFNEGRTVGKRSQNVFYAHTGANDSPGTQNEPEQVRWWK